MCSGTLILAWTDKARRWEEIQNDRCAPALGFALILIVIVTCFSASLDPCYLEHRQIVLASSAIWLDSMLSSGMKLIRADPAVLSSGMLTQAVIAAVVGSILLLSEQDGIDVEPCLHPTMPFDKKITSRLKGHLDNPNWISQADSGACLSLLLFIRVLKSRIDRLGHLVIGSLLLVAWAVCTAWYAGSSGFYIACNMLSFIAPVMVESISPIDVDMLQLITKPSLRSFALFVVHSATNSIDRIFSSVVHDGQTLDEDRMVANLEMMGAKVVLLFMCAVYFRWALARGLALPFWCCNEKLLRTQRGVRPSVSDREGRIRADFVTN